MERILIYGIAYGCPAGKRNINCPLERVSNLSFKEKLSWIEDLTEEQLKTIVEYHKHCSNSRENEFSLKLNL